MNIVFLGPPGAGKGTQTQRLIETRKMFSLSTGDLLRNAVEKGTKLGLEAKAYMENGTLVPDELMIKLISEKLDELGGEADVIFDGFPRTIAQAKELDLLLKSRGKAIDIVLEIVVDQDILLKRITGRYICKGCNNTFHDLYSKPKNDGICDYCQGTEFFRRSDDKEETLKKRLKSYNIENNKIKPFYEGKDILFQIDGMESKDTVTQKIDEILQRQTLTYRAIKV